MWSIACYWPKFKTLTVNYLKRLLWQWPWIRVSFLFAGQISWSSIDNVRTLWFDVVQKYEWNMTEWHFITKEVRNDLRILFCTNVLSKRQSIVIFLLCTWRDVTLCIWRIANFNFANVKNSSRKNITSHEKWFMEIIYMSVITNNRTRVIHVYARWIH